jgi:hypothetical protein
VYTAKTRYPACLSVLLTLSLSYPASASFSHARAAFSHVTVSGNITWLNTSFYAPYSYSDVDMGGSPGSFDVGATDTHAQVALSSGLGEASTSLYNGSTDSRVIAPALKEVYGRAEAHQSLSFMANSAGSVTIQLDYLCGLDLMADPDGGWAKGQAAVLAKLRSYDSSLDKVQGWELWYGIEDGDDFSKVDAGILLITVNLLQDQKVRLDLYALSDASAYSVVPVPGAVALGMVGLAALGCLRRRRTL